jgi:hypothetical protein
MTNLSPAAQAVLDAANGRNSWGPDDILNESRWIAAAALRAAADQVVPQGGVFLMTASQDRIRHQLLAIAAELEALSND